MKDERGDKENPPGGDFSRTARRTMNMDTITGTTSTAHILRAEPDSRALPGGAWELASSLSVRATCRVYRGDGRGGWTNRTRERVMGARPPHGPWAIYLSDGSDYWLACFDLDAHDGDESSRRRAEADAARCAGLLRDAGLEPVICRSGPSGGMHVWASSLERVPAPLMRSIAMRMRLLLPSLDPTPLLNPRTGCARPPLSPHRDGGASVPVDGDPWTLDIPVARADAWERLDRTLRALTDRLTGPDTVPVREQDRAGAVLDADGMPWIPGDRRPLPARAQRLLDAPLPAGADASPVMFAILVSAARAHWRLHDMAGLLSRPGMTHAMSAGAGRGVRIPRPLTGPGGAMDVLGRDWERAVKAASRSGPRPGSDPGWRERSLSTLSAVTATLRAMRAGRVGFDMPGGASRLRVLTALCLLCARANRTDVQADVRRLALMCGVGRETARTALERLRADRWVTLERRGEGRSANRWALARKPGGMDALTVSCQGRSQVEHAPWSMLSDIAGRLSGWLSLCSHDLFQGQDRSRAEGNALADTYCDPLGTGPAPGLARLTRRLDTEAARLGRRASERTDGTPTSAKGWLGRGGRPSSRGCAPPPGPPSGVPAAPLPQARPARSLPCPADAMARSAGVRLESQRVQMQNPVSGDIMTVLHQPTGKGTRYDPMHDTLEQLQTRPARRRLRVRMRHGQSRHGIRAMRGSAANGFWHASRRTAHADPGFQQKVGESRTDLAQAPLGLERQKRTSRSANGSCRRQASEAGCTECLGHDITHASGGHPHAGHRYRAVPHRRGHDAEDALRHLRRIPGHH